MRGSRYRKTKISTTHITTMKSKKQRRKMLPQGIPLLSTSILNHSLELRVSVAARLPVAPTTPNTHIQTSTQHTLYTNPKLPCSLSSSAALCDCLISDKNTRSKSSVTPRARGESHLSRKPEKAASVYLMSRLISIQKHTHTHTLSLTR